MNVDPVAYILHTYIFSAAFLAKAHQRTYKFARRIDIHVGDRFKRRRYGRRIGVIGRIVDRYGLAVCKLEFIFNARSGRNKVEIILPFKALLNYFHVKQSQESAAEAEAERP